MEPILKTTLLFVVFGTLAFYSKSISREVENTYNNSVAFMAKHTVVSSPILLK